MPPAYARSDKTDTVPSLYFKKHKKLPHRNERCDSFYLSVNKRFDLLAQKHGDYHLRTVKRNVGNNSCKKSLL